MKVMKLSEAQLRSLVKKMLSESKSYTRAVVALEPDMAWESRMMCRDLRCSLSGPGDSPPEDPMTKLFAVQGPALSVFRFMEWYDDQMGAGGTLSSAAQNVFGEPIEGNPPPTYDEYMGM